MLEPVLICDRVFLRAAPEPPEAVIDSISLGSTFRFRPMETLDPLLLSMVTLGFAFTLTVFVVAFRQVDRSEKERAQLNRMRGRLNRLLQHRS